LNLNYTIYKNLMAYVFLQTYCLQGGAVVHYLTLFQVEFLLSIDMDLYNSI
jgi:hypothetical protein